VLKPFVPDVFAGLPNEQQRRKGGLGMLMMSNAKASLWRPREQDRRSRDHRYGRASALVGLASWVQGEKEDDNGSERTTKENGRLVARAHVEGRRHE